jgi:hypothetical protein
MQAALELEAQGSRIESIDAVWKRKGKLIGQRIAAAA